jgi:hypothetical protein
MPFFGEGITVRRVPAGGRDKEMTVTDPGLLLEVDDVHRVLDSRAAEITDRVVSEGPAAAGGGARPLTPAVRGALTAVARDMMVRNLVFDRAETEERRQAAAAAVRPVVIPIKKGEMIIRDGDKIQSRHIVIFNGMRAQVREFDRVQSFVGIAGLFLLLVGVYYRYGARNIRKFRVGLKDLVYMALALVAVLVCGHVARLLATALADRFTAVPESAYAFAIPVAAAAMLTRLVLNSEVALVFLVVACVLAGLQLDLGFEHTAFFLLTSAVAASASAQAKQRSTLLKAGTLSGVAGAAAVVCFGLGEGAFVTSGVLYDAAFAFGGGVLSAMLVTAFTPAVEALFGYTTDIKLLELANLNHPVLRELILHAPGSYHHSIVVGSLVEAAAESIGANPLLARVMAYYHDIGKSKNPMYFAENQKGQNPHDKLSPSLSAVIIRSHVKDGMEMARKFRLGQRIEDAIGMHHGTTLMRYFFHKARKQQAADAAEINESDYRHGGPKPQYREAALLMVADGVEAAVKSLPDPTPARIEQVVQKIINLLFTDGQFEECDLTLRDLNRIARSFTRSLQSVYHYRPEYPEEALRTPREEEIERERAKEREENGERRVAAHREEHEPRAAAPGHAGAWTELDIDGAEEGPGRLGLS